MKNIVYPAIFEKDLDVYNVRFIDLEGCYTFGDSIENAVEMAKEAMGLYLDDIDIKDMPKATVPFNHIKLNENEFITLISIDLVEYKEKNDNRAIKKTLTIPNWLNVMAEKNNINFSQTLQKALKKELGIE